MMHTMQLSSLVILFILSACTEQVKVASETSDVDVELVASPPEGGQQDPVLALRSTLMAAALSVPRMYLAENFAPPESPPGDILRLRARVRSEPGSHEARFALAEALHTARDYAAAEQAYREAIRLDRGHVPSHAGLARLLISLDRQDVAAEVIDAALASSAATAELHALRGAAAAEQGELGRAVNSYRSALSLDESHERGYFELAFTLERQGLSEAAIAALRSGLDQIPGSIGLRLKLAELLATTAAYDEASNELRVLLEADPTLSPAIVALARLQRQRGDHTNARRVVDTGLEIDPSSVDLAGELGILLLEEGKELEAIPHLERAIYRDPDLLDACEALGRAYEHTGDTARAQIVLEYATHVRDHADEMVLFKTAIALDKTDAHAFFDAGRTYSHLARPLAASQALEVGLQIIPDNIEALSNLGLVLLSLQQLPRAIETYERILALDATALSAYANLGSALIVSGEPERALATYEEALEVDADFAPFYMGLARAYEHLGRPEDARGALAEFKRLGAAQ